MPTFLNVENGEVLGYVSGSKIQPFESLIEVDQDVLRELAELERQMASASQPGRVLFSNGKLSLPQDARPYLSITADKEYVAADGQDSARVTVRFLLPDGSTDTRVSGSQIFKTQSGRHWRLDFVDGVAVKDFRTDKSGRFDIESTYDFRLREPFSLVAYE